MWEDKGDFNRELMTAIEESRKAIIKANLGFTKAIIDTESAFYNGQISAIQLMFDYQMTLDELFQKETEFRNKMNNYSHIGEFLLTIGIGILAVGIALPDSLTRILGLVLISFGGLSFLIIILKVNDMKNKFKKDLNVIMKKHDESSNNLKANFEKRLIEINGRG